MSLVELLLVIAIVSIAAGVAVPLYRGYVYEAEIGNAIHEIRGISLLLDGLALEDSLPATLAEVGLSAADPWGNPYQYQRIAGEVLSGTGSIKVRKDKNLHPLNTDYDLYSMGADGATKIPLTAKASHDDVVRAGNGRFVGLGADY